MCAITARRLDLAKMPLVERGNPLGTDDVRALNDSVLAQDSRARHLRPCSGAILAWPLRIVPADGRARMNQLREEKSRAKWSTIITLCSAVPGAGKSLLATNLMASLAWETGEPVLMLDFSGRQRGTPLLQCKPVAVSNGLPLESLLAHHPLGYDRLNLQLTGDAKEIAAIAPLFGDLSKRYKYVLVDLPNQTGPSVFSA